MVALIPIALLFATPAPAVPALTLQPSSLPCSATIAFDASGSLPASTAATINGRTVASEIAGNSLKLHLDTAHDCGNSLTISFGALQQTYRIESAPAVTTPNPPPEDPVSLSRQIESLHDTVVLVGGIAAIAIFSSCIALIWMTLRLSSRVGPLGVSTTLRDPVPPARDAAAYTQLTQTLNERFKELRSSIAELKRSTPAAPRQTKQERFSPPEPPPVLAPPVQESVLPEPEPTPMATTAPPFMEIYKQLSSGDQDGLPKPIVVNFRNPDVVDRKPDEVEPLVRDNNGTLIVLEHAGLAKGEYYLAPLPDFQGQWSETHTRRWRSLFKFTSPRAMDMVEPAVVRAEGNEWTIVRKGTFS